MTERSQRSYIDEALEKEEELLATNKAIADAVRDGLGLEIGPCKKGGDHEWTVEGEFVPGPNGGSTKGKAWCEKCTRRKIFEIPAERLAKKLNRIMESEK